MNTALQKATELGVASISPVETANSSVAKRQFEKRTRQWRQVIQSASEQCGRTQIPVLNKISGYKNFLAGAKADLKLLPSPLASVSLSELKDPVTSVCLVIGPEGGFTELETDMATDSGFLPVSLGSRILRAETVPAALIALLQYRWGDF